MVRYHGAVIGMLMQCHANRQVVSVEDETPMMAFGGRWVEASIVGIDPPSCAMMIMDCHTITLICCSVICFLVLLISADTKCTRALRL